jgi:EmrB/QacA subfamily drug resistance transporter
MKTNTVNRKDIPFIMLGLMMALLMASLDSTIVSTALPTIAVELDGVQHFTWPVTAYMLSSTIALLIFGKLADIYGRRKVFLFGIITFILTSVLCGMAQTMDQLIIFRGLQGIGGGAISSVTFIIVGDLFSSRERGKYMGILASMFALASVIGPFLGGFITDNLDWRWVFYVNVPFGVLSFILMFVKLPNFRSEHVKPHIDYLGIGAVSLGVVPLLLAISWGGSEIAWGSMEMIAMISVSIVSLIAFVWLESRAVEPILPLRIFKKPTFNIATLCSAMAFFVMMGAIMAITLYAQGVKGMSATASGQVLTPAVLVLALVSIMTGRTISTTGKYRIFGIVGFGVTCVGAWLLSGISMSTPIVNLYLYSAVLGAGIGLTMPVFSIAIQNVFEPHERATATASNRFLSNIGGTLGLAALNNIIAGALVGGFHPSTLLTSLQGAFLLCMAVSVIGLIIAVFLKEVPLKTHDAMVQVGTEA